MIRRAACHCGAVRFEIELEDFASRRRCNCSMCRMRGAVAVSVPMEKLRITQGADALTAYRFNTRSAEHFFCRHCGIYTHHQRRSTPNEYGANAACIEGVSPFDFAEVPVTDGVHHSKDDPNGGGVVGVLRYEAVD